MILSLSHHEISSSTRIFIQITGINNTSSKHAILFTALRVSYIIIGVPLILRCNFSQHLTNDACYRKGGYSEALSGRTLLQITPIPKLFEHAKQPQYIISHKYLRFGCYYCIFEDNLFLFRF